MATIMEKKWVIDRWHWRSNFTYIARWTNGVCLFEQTNASDEFLMTSEFNVKNYAKNHSTITSFRYEHFLNNDYSFLILISMQFKSYSLRSIIIVCLHFGTQLSLCIMYSVWTYLNVSLYISEYVSVTYKLPLRNVKILRSVRAICFKKRWNRTAITVECGGS